MRLSPFKIEDEATADRYLTDLIAKPEYRSMIEVEARAVKYIPNKELRRYFMGKAEFILRKV